jgi:hypothetical protein
LTSAWLDALNETAFEQPLYILMRFIERAVLPGELNLRIKTFTSIDVKPLYV